MAIFWFLPHHLSSQLINCNCLYYINNNQIYKYNPSLPLSATNPDTTGIHTPDDFASRIATGGLAISRNLNGAGPSPTFYITVRSGYDMTPYMHYYDGTKWVNTGHAAKSVNLCGAGDYIFGLVGETGEVYRYDGTGDAVLVTKVDDARYEGPYDLIGNCIGDWYLMNSTGRYASRTLRKFDSTGKLLKTWAIKNPRNYMGFAGFAIMGNTIYCDDYSRQSMFNATIDATSDTINFNNDPINVYCGINDLASCDGAVSVTPTISIKSFCNGTTPPTVTCKATTYAGGSNPAYQWRVNGVSKGTNSPIFTYSPSIGDKVTCEMTSNASCVSSPFAMSNELTINNITPPTLTLDKSPSFCPGDSVLLHVSGADFYSWSNGSKKDSTYIAKTGSYSVTGSSSNGCTGVLSFTATAYNKPDYKITSKLTDCNKHTVQFTPQEANSNNYADSFFWDFGDKTTSSLRQPSHSFSVPGQYSIKLTVTNTSGCDSIFNQVITVPASPTLSINKTAIFCIGNSVVIKAQGAKNYVWQDGSTADSLLIQNTGNYFFTGTSVDGCTSTYNFTATNYPQPDYSIAAKLTDCNKRQYQFAASLNSGKDSGDSFGWVFGDNSKGNTQTVDHAFAAASNYIVSLMVTSPNNCSSFYNKTITVEAPPTLTLDKQPKFCRETPMLVTVTGAANYKWSEGSASDHLAISKEGTYSVTGYSPAGCFTTSTFNATYFDLFNYQILTDKEEISPDQPLLNMESKEVPSSFYSWDFGDGQTADGRSQSHTYSIPQSGYFNIALNVINPYGCMEKASKRIWIANNATINSFTPNGDGKNDLFMAGWHIQVYNRDGVLLYDGADGWNGKYKGKVVAKDTYLYVVYYETGSGIKSKPGYVMVVR